MLEIRIWGRDVRKFIIPVVMCLFEKEKLHYVTMNLSSLVQWLLWIQ